MDMAKQDGHWGKLVPNVGMVWLKAGFGSFSNVYLQIRYISAYKKVAELKFKNFSSKP